MRSGGENFVIDAKFLVESSNHAFCGAPLIVTPDGVDQTFVFGFTRDLLRLRLSLGIQSFICVFTSDGNSPDIISRAVDFMRELQIPHIYEQKWHRGSIFKTLARNSGWIVSRDMSLAQLVREDRHLIVPQEDGEFSVITVEWLKKQFGIRPDQVSSFFTLHDDKDPLLTKRQAKKFLEDHHSLADFNNVTKLKKTGPIEIKVLQNKAALQSRYLQLTIDAPIELSQDWSRQFFGIPTDSSICEQRLRNRGFHSLARLLKLRDEPRVNIHPHREVATDSIYKVVDSKRPLSSLRLLLERTDVCSLDTETSGKDPRTAKLYGVSISTASGTAFYVPLIQSSLNGLTVDQVTKQLASFFSRKIKVVGHNLKYDLLVLHRHGIKVKFPYFDTMLAAYQCFGDCDYFNLSYFAKKFLGKRILRYNDIVKKGETFLDVPFSELVEHACADAETTLQLFYKLIAELKARQALDTFHQDTMTSMVKLHQLEAMGLSVNLRRINESLESLSGKAFALKTKIYGATGAEFDLDSIKSIGEVLKNQEWYRENFLARQISSSAIEHMASRHPMIAAIAEYRRVRRKIAELNEVITSVENGKVRAVFNQVRESCGQITSSDPCLEATIAARAISAKIVVGKWYDPEQALQQLSILAKDPLMASDCQDQNPMRFLNMDSIVVGIPNLEIVIFLAISPSEEAMAKQFLISRSLAAKAHREIVDRYGVTFSSIAMIRKSAVVNGFVERNRRRKYLQGLQSSDVNKRNEALKSAIKWLLFGETVSSK